ncbi:type II secretion system protein [Microbacterium sp. ProA8]|uniref:type II secretion system protein n=1 Tax=Microbacterium chionoecetis TaxID=3153754 RepID=UPI003267935B
MRVRGADAAGFSLVEVVIAMFLLGIIAVAILPALWQGITYSSQQSAVATATRHLNGLIEQARQDAACGRTVLRPASAPPSVPADIPAVPNAAAFLALNSAWNGVDFEDGKGEAYTVVAHGAVGAGGVRASYACVPNAITEIELQALDSAGREVAVVTAKILMGP